MDVVMWGTEPIGGPFTLVDHTGTPRSDKDFRGKVLLVYFGFSYCSDICPTDLQSVAAAVDRLGPEGEKVQPLFISVDPDKDTPEQLKTYVALFHPRLVGLTGAHRQVRKVALAYKVYVANNVAATGSTGAIDHSGFVYLMGPTGEYLGFFPPGTSAERMVAALRPHLAALSQQ
ncbi:MAG: redoxin domain-containing protein [Rhizobiales bacterium]|nr:redoxin domain-containing protein [Hyphomicrobiales bacterium]